LSVVGGNTKREQGRKVQESNVAAAKVSDNMSIVCMLGCGNVRTCGYWWKA